jgi:hypothetical protein
MPRPLGLNQDLPKHPHRTSNRLNWIGQALKAQRLKPITNSGWNIPACVICFAYANLGAIASDSCIYSIAMHFMHNNALVPALIALLY